jgi:hypothetical protein
MQEVMNPAATRFKIGSLARPIALRGFAGQLFAWTAASAVFVGIWIVSGRGLFWPVLPIVACGISIVFYTLVEFAEPPE